MVTQDERPVLIIGATGTVGSEVLRSAHARGIRCRVLLRSPERAQGIPSGVEIIKGDLKDDTSVKRALGGVRSAFYVSPHVDGEEEIAARFTASCAESSVRMVFVGVHADGKSRFSRWLQRGAYGALMPHYKGKLRLSERVRRSEADVVILNPTNFYQNDELARPALMDERRYLHPVGMKGMNRIDARDIGDAASRALVDDDVKPGVYPLYGPESLNGPQCAAVWSDALGESVDYEEDDTAWEAMVSATLSGRKLDDILKTYRKLRKFKLATDPKIVASTADLIGHPPRSYRDYVAHTLEGWRQRNAAA